MFVVSSFLSDCHHTKAWTPHTLWLNYCSSILISLFPRVSWLIHYNVVHVSLLLKNLRWIQFSFFSLFERSFHHSRLLFFPLSFQYYFPLVLLSWLICYLWTLFIWILSVLFFLSTVYPYHHYLQPIRVLPDWAQILSLKGFFNKDPSLCVLMYWLDE